MFFGTSTFAVPALRALTRCADVVAVVTQPDRPAGRGQKLLATPVKAQALALGLPLIAPGRLRPFASELAALGAECSVVASYGRIVPPDLLAAVPLWLNLHPSQLPLYRGATPIQSAIRDGRETTAVSLIAMDAGMDTGDLLAQTEPLPIAPEETYGELHDRLAEIAAYLLADILGADARGVLVRMPQAERARRRGISEAEIAATLTRPWTKADAILRPEMSARAMVDTIRALAPKPGASLGADVRPLAGGAGLGYLKILRAHVTAPGPSTGGGLPALAVVVERGALFLRAHDGWLRVERVLPAGRGTMAADAFVAGRRIVGAFVPV